MPPGQASRFIELSYFWELGRDALVSIGRIVNRCSTTYAPRSNETSGSFICLSTRLCLAFKDSFAKSILEFHTTRIARPRRRSVRIRWPACGMQMVVAGAKPMSPISVRTTV